MIAHGCDPGVAKNLVYSGLLGVVDALPLMSPHDWRSKKAAYIAPNDYDTAMSQMAEASSEMLEALPSIFPNFQGYFLFGEAHDFFRKYMGKSKHPVLNTERVVHPTSIACKLWDMDHQLVAVRQACQALSAATGLDFHHSNIKNFDDVMPVSAGMKRKSEERLNAVIRREEEEEERLLDEAICREGEAKREAKRVSKAKSDRKRAVEEAAAAAAKWKDFFLDVRTCVRLCKDVGCCRLAFSNGVCSGHGPRCSHVGCDNDVRAKNVCRDHGPRCSHVGCDKNVYARNFCREHDIKK